MGPKAGAKSYRESISTLLAWLVLAFAVVCVFFANRRFGPMVLAVGFQDDFFYYATVARNLALHGRSTFDGIHLTNGYHPLWLLILTALTWLSRSGSVMRFAFLVEWVQALLLGAVAISVSRIARRFCSMPWALTLQLLAASIALLLLRSGMEGGLAIAAAFALLDFRTRPGFAWTARNAIGYGTLSALLVLSRIDSALLVLLLFALDVMPAAIRERRTAQIVPGFAIGALPVAVYLGINEAVFGTLLPISGTAKQLRAHHLPSLRTLGSFVSQTFSIKSPVYGLFAILTVLALGLLLVRRPRMDGREGVFRAVLLFPFLYILVFSCTSDWPVWDWYLYSWCIAGVFAALLLATTVGQLAWVKALGPAVFAACALLLGSYSLLLFSGSNPAQGLTYLAGMDVQRFAATHPGTYAMGDRSGAVGYLSSQPVIQLEGLMMDKPYLENIRERRELRSVLRGYGVRYYISTEYPDRLTKCFTAREPVQAGPDSPVISGTFCSEPLAVIPHGYLTNRIFDVTSPD